MAKATDWTSIDAEVRKRGEQTGLDTLVVHAVNDDNYLFGLIELEWSSSRIKLSAWGVRSQD